MLLFFIVGDILGGGIYALVGEVGDKVGGAIWTAFALAGVVATFTAAPTPSMGCTLIELSGLLLVAVIGAAFLLDGGGDAGRALEFKDGDGPLLLVISGASLAFYALIVSRTRSTWRRRRKRRRGRSRGRCSSGSGSPARSTCW